ncbi:PD-(D/E)XK nuclease family protein [Sphingomonas sp. LY160]|uniref:PD-(D/E)XK nuclease family protein n=1 Tax=Sphingomonas sp. LY160 TaxID=3095342 RepID=UPI002ADECD7D|nr:PD-(D/E)XK nuclease family protein [Sphingomonas sp. LY160]MEA1071724.1 PD-(D/E)XK nuclease family protein [Sphingomonas sp. LY160]
MNGRDNLPARLSTFVERWQSTSDRDPRVRSLEQFFHRFAAVRPRHQVRLKTRGPDLSRLRRFIEDAAAPLENLRATGSNINPWAVAGLKRTEVRNAAVLASLLSPRLCGEQAVTLLDNFCRRLPDPAGILPSTTELRAGYSVRTEHCPVGERTERVDLTIEGRTFVLGIEVKIDANEGVEQLRRYIATLSRWGRQRGKRSVVVFLAPYPPSEPGVVAADWRDVAAAGRSIVPRLKPGANYHSHLLDGFVRHIANFGG